MINSCSVGQRRRWWPLATHHSVVSDWEPNLVGVSVRPPHTLHPVRVHSCVLRMPDGSHQRDECPAPRSVSGSCMQEEEEVVAGDKLNLRKRTIGSIVVHHHMRTERACVASPIIVNARTREKGKKATDHGNDSHGNGASIKCTAGPATPRTSRGSYRSKWGEWFRVRCVSRFDFSIFPWQKLPSRMTSSVHLLALTTVHGR